MAELNNTIVRGNLRVVSQMEAQEILENGTSLANKYLEITDISDWAKAANKPSYIFTEIGAGHVIIGDGANYALYRTHESWRSGYYYHTTGSEAVVFANKNASTSWIFVNAVDPTDRKDWTNLGQVPAMQIKTNSVAINKLIANGATPSYNLDVNGTANATTLYENGTALSSKYLPLAGGTMTGTITSRNIIPSSSNSYSLGSASYFYNDIYSFGTHTDRIMSNLWNVVTFYDEEQEVCMAEIGNTTPPEEQPGSGTNLSYIMIGSGLTYKHEDAWTELRMSCANSMESEYEDYITIRTNGRQAGAVLYLPGIGSGDVETLATTSDIPSVLPAAYVTTPPSSNNYVGIKFVLLNSQTYPESSVTKRNGYIYMWY